MKKNTTSYTVNFGFGKKKPESTFSKVMNAVGQGMTNMMEFSDRNNLRTSVSEFESQCSTAIVAHRAAISGAKTTTYTESLFGTVVTERVNPVSYAMAEADWSNQLKGAELKYDSICRDAEYIARTYRRMEVRLEVNGLKARAAAALAKMRAE